MTGLLPGYISDVPDDFGYWFSGLADGEGSFNIGVHKDKVSCTFHIAFRIDDLPTLEIIRSTLRIGNIFFENPRCCHSRKNNPSARWVVQAAKESVVLVQLFRRFPLRSKKRYDFGIWAEAVEFLAAHRAYGNRWVKSGFKPSRNLALVKLKTALETGRQFR